MYSHQAMAVFRDLLNSLLESLSMYAGAKATLTLSVPGLANSINLLHIYMPLVMRGSLGLSSSDRSSKYRAILWFGKYQEDYECASSSDRKQPAREISLKYTHAHFTCLPGSACSYPAHTVWWDRDNFGLMETQPKYRDNSQIITNHSRTRPRFFGIISRPNIAIFESSSPKQQDNLTPR